MRLRRPTMKSKEGFACVVTIIYGLDASRAL